MFTLAHAGHFTGDPWHDSWSVAVIAAALLPAIRMWLSAVRVWAKLRSLRRKQKRED